MPDMIPNWYIEDMSQKAIQSSGLFLFSAVLSLFLMTCSNQHPISENPNILRIGTPDRVQSANIFLDSHLSMLAHIANPPLMKIDHEGRLTGQLLRDIRVSDDFKFWSLTVDDNLYWSDGRKMTAEDIQFSILYTKENYPAAGWLNEVVEEVTIEDSGQVHVRLNKPYTRLDFELATHKILPKHIWSNIPDPMKYTNPKVNVGCGPFFIQSINLSKGVILFTKNPYWKGKRPAIEGIEIHIYSNKDALSLALEKGEVDAYYSYASSYPYSSLQKIRKTSRFDYLEYLNTGFVFLGFNLNQAPMSDLQFRNALCLSIDFEEIIKLDLLGYGQTPNRGLIPPTMEHFKETPALVFDSTRAGELLRQANYQDSNGNGLIEDPNGKDISLTLLTTSKFARIAELVSTYLQSLGIGIQIKTVDDSTWVSLKDRYRYDLTISRTSPWGMHMHADWATGYFDKRRTGEGVLHTVDDIQFLSLCDKILSTKEREELQSYAFAVQDYYAKNLPAIALYWNTIVFPVSRAYTGWITDPLYGLYTIDSFLNLERTVH